MPLQSDENRELWLFLLQDGKAWTVADLAKHRNSNPDRLFLRLTGMLVNGHLEKLPPLKGRRYRYAVTGTCRVPLGLHVAEVQV